MISVTRLDGSVMVVNDEQIAWIEPSPDTVISMMNGEKLRVRETPETLVERSRAFKRSIRARLPLHAAPQAQVSAVLMASSDDIEDETSADGGDTVEEGA